MELVKVLGFGKVDCSVLFQLVFADGEHAELAKEPGVLQILSSFFSQSAIIHEELMKVGEVAGGRQELEAIIHDLVLTHVKDGQVPHGIGRRKELRPLDLYLIVSDLKRLEGLQVADLPQLLGPGVL